MPSLTANTCFLSFFAVLALSCPQSIATEPDPNRDRFIQPAPEEFPELLDEESIFPEGESIPEEEIIPGSGVFFPIQKIEVLDSTVFSEEDFAPIVTPLEGREVTLEQLQAVAAAITQLYLSEGYLNSRAIVREQAIQGGVVQIQVIEGVLSEIQINGLVRVHPHYVRSRVRRGVTQPLNVNELEDKLRLLRTDPLFEEIEVQLQPGEELGETILVLNINEAKSFYGSGFVDNYSAASIGSERIGVSLGYRNFTGWGDNFTITHTRSTTGGSKIFNFGYTIPVNAKQGTVSLRVVLDENEVTQSPFDQLGIQGESQIYEIGFRQPIIRTSVEEFALSVGFVHRRGQTFLFEDVGTPFGVGAEPDGTTRTSVLRFGQDYIRRDTTGAWAARSQFNIGTGLFDATRNAEPIPDGRFLSWLGQLQRVQRLSPNNLLIVQADVQLSPDNLLGSETFTIGGAQTVRGFRQGARVGDNGFRLTIEDRITLERDSEGVSTFQIAPFFDLGVVFDNGDNPNQRPNQNFLAGLGLGILWSPIENFNLRLDGTLSLVNLRDRGENAQDDGFYFSASYHF